MTDRKHIGTVLAIAAVWLAHYCFFRNVVCLDAQHTTGFCPIWSTYASVVALVVEAFVIFVFGDLFWWAISRWPRKRRGYYDCAERKK